MPSKSGVYLYHDKKGDIIYIGKAKDLKKRVASYFSDTNLSPKVARMVADIAYIDYILTSSELDAFLLEANLIKEYKPFYNIKLSDDKFFPYIKISKNENPYVTITRKKDDRKAVYYGPYPSVTPLKTVYKIMRRIFPFQSVKNHPKVRCFYNHLGLCPCIPVFPQNLPEYKKNLRKLKKFLSGGRTKVVSELEKERDVYIKKEEFEKAKSVQEKINRIEIITSENYDPFSETEEASTLIAKASNELDGLKSTLHTYYPHIEDLTRIECYDISNIQGTNATGSMVVFHNGIADKAEYRRFRIRTKNTPDDFSMMREVLTRRLKRDDWDNPQLIIVDGGKGQVSAAVDVFDSTGCMIPLIGLAKREEIIVVPIKNPDGTLSFEEIRLPLSNPGLTLIRRIRDEAHRFAITYHRHLRKKKFLSS